MRDIKTIFTVIMSLFIFFTGPVLALDSLTLEDALSSGLNNNSSIKQIRLEEEKAEFELELARKNRYPTLDLQSSYTRLDQAPRQFAGIDETFQPIYIEGSRNNYSTQLTLQQPIYTGGQIGLGIKQAEKGLTMADIQTRQTKSEVFFNIVQAYYNLLMAEDRVEIEEEALKVVREHKKIVNASFKQGMALKTDILQIEIKESESKQSLDNARNQLILAQKNLANLIGIDQLDFQVKEPALKPNLELDNINRLYQLALKNRSDFNMLSVNKDIIETNIELEEKSHLPKLILAGNYNWQGSEFKLDGGSWSVTMSGSLSIFDGGKSSTREKKHRKELTRLEESRANLEQMIKLDLERKILAAEENLNKIQIQELNINRARENLRLEKLRFREGIGTNIDVMNAQTTLKQTRMIKMQAEYQYQLNLFELLQSTGQLVEYCEEVIDNEN